MSDLSKSISEEVINQIRDSLPGMVSGELLEYIKQSEKQKKELENSRERNDSLEKKLKEKSELLLEYRTKEEELEKLKFDLGEKEISLKEKEFNLDKKEKGLELKEKLLDIIEKHSKEKVNLLKDVLGTVFANNKFKYDRTLRGSMPVPVEGIPGYENYGSFCPPTGGSVITGSVETDETVEGEG